MSLAAAAPGVSMMVSNRGSFIGVLFWQWQHTLVFIAGGLAAWFGHDVMVWKHVALPAAPATVTGAALGIFASFRANAAYARWWEGRQLWGKLVNASRMWATQTRAYLSDAAVADTLVRRHALYVHVLRCQLRDDDVFADEHVRRLSNRLDIDADEEARLKSQTSMCHALLDVQMQALMKDKGLDPLRLQSLDSTIMTFLDVQGGCERIKRTPMPRGYGFFVERLLLFFSVLFPLAIVKEVGWAVIPVNIIVCMGFALISETGRVLEDPFTHFWNSLPLSNMSANIERNISQRLGDTDLVAPVTVDKKGIMW
jgi:putative membrane protein